MLAIMFPWVIMTPFGVPEEKKKTTFKQKRTKRTQVLVIGKTLSTEKISALSYPRSYMSLGKSLPWM